MHVDRRAKLARLPESELFPLLFQQHFSASNAFTPRFDQLLAAVLVPAASDLHAARPEIDPSHPPLVRLEQVNALDYVLIPDTMWPEVRDDADDLSGRFPERPGQQIV